MRSTRRLALVIAMCASLAGRSAWGEVAVPAKLQAQLTAKIAAYDRNYGARAGETGLLLVVYKPGDAESLQFAQLVGSAFRDLSDVGGLPKTVDVIPFVDAATLATTCRSRRAALVYLSVGLEADDRAIAGALAGADVLSVGASGSDAEHGAVVGFDLDGGRPKIVINLASARAQNVSLKADLLKLARIVGG